MSSLIETFGTPRMPPAFADALAAEPGVLLVGTDPAEWWADPDDLRRVVQAQSTELQGATAKVTHSEAWVHREVGWAAVRTDAAFPDGSAAMLRITATLARRASTWKIVQCHMSVGAANEEVVGKELTV
ncbi:MAG: nuclear transport factor 2 family protein [Streptosporangiaceae bacterium]